MVKMKKWKWILTGAIIFVVLLAIDFSASTIEDLGNDPEWANRLALKHHNDIFCVVQESANKDKCLDKFAYQFNNSNSCMKIENSDKRDVCLISLLFLDNDFDCSRIIEAKLRSACENKDSYDFGRTGGSINVSFDI